MTIERTVEPAQVGLDARQLANLDRAFARWVDDGRLTGWQIVVTRRGEVAHAATYGYRDKEAGLPVTPDTLWRIYSMTKPLTSVAAMMLWEEGAFELTDPISTWLPEFANPMVYEKGTASRPFVVPAVEPIRVWHLLTHTSGLTYGFTNEHPVDAIYRANGWDVYGPAGQDLAAASVAWAKLPLRFQPGSAWGYGVSTDVLGRLVEVVSGQSLDEFFAARILGPLGLTDTVWHVEGERAGRLAALYTPNPADGGRAARIDFLGAKALAKPDFLSGGGGLISTAADYHKFTQMLLGKGTYGASRLLGRRTLDYMTHNHLPGGVDLAALSSGGFAETNFEGIGFGLGFAVVNDPAPGKSPMSPGSFYWGGAANTFFWVDPAEELTALFFTQSMPSSYYPLRPYLRQLVYAALI